MTAEWLTHTLLVNAIGPTLLSKAYLPLLEKPGRRGVIMNISSRLSSFSGDHGTYAPSYCMSKAALNMLVRAHTTGKPFLCAHVRCLDIQASSRETRPDILCCQPRPGENRCVAVSVHSRSHNMAKTSHTAVRRHGWSRRTSDAR
jgi:hypothetical protein